MESKVIAIIGLSSDPKKDSHIVAKFLSENSFRIIPVNPNAKEILNGRSYPSLLSIPKYNAKNIDIIDIFRPSKEVPGITLQACEFKRKFGKPSYIWMQIGISSLEAAKIAKECDIDVVMNRCIMMEYKRLFPKAEN